jgi:hypothetical protein
MVNVQMICTDLPSLLAPSKTNRLIDFYDVILMMGVTMHTHTQPMLLGTSDRYCSCMRANVARAVAP